MSLSQSLVNKVYPESGTNKSQRLSDQYKHEVFVLWYNHSQPAAVSLVNLIGVDLSTGEKASIQTLKRWISEEFSIKALEINKKVTDEMDQVMVQDKVTMLKRHAEIAMRMQEKALEYLEEHGIGSAKNAIVLLTKAIEIERNSRSLPKFLAEIEKMPDDELIEEIRRLSQGDDVIDLDDTMLS